MAIARSAEGEDSHGRRWLAVLYVNGYHELLPVGHSGDPATLADADYDRLLDPVLPSDDEETDECDPYLADLDRCFDRWKDRARDPGGPV